MDVDTEWYEGGMLEQAGLVVDGAWGDADGNELSFDAIRLILLARRPA